MLFSTRKLHRPPQHSKAPPNDPIAAAEAADHLHVFFELDHETFRPAVAGLFVPGTSTGIGGLSYRRTLT